MALSALLGSWFDMPELRQRAHVLELKEYRDKRTLEQNARYWALVTALGEHVGLAAGDMHEEVLCTYHGYDLVEFRGSVRKVPRGRSKNLTIDEFSEYMAIVDRWCAEEGVMIE